MIDDLSSHSPFNETYSISKYVYYELLVCHWTWWKWIYMNNSDLCKGKHFNQVTFPSVFSILYRNRQPSQNFILCIQNHFIDWAMFLSLEATYSKSKNVVTSTPYSQNKSLTSVSRGKLYTICAKWWKSMWLLDENTTIFSRCPYKKKIFKQYGPSSTSWWKFLTKYASTSRILEGLLIKPNKKREAHNHSTACHYLTTWYSLSTRTPIIHNMAVTLPAWRKLGHSWIWLLSSSLAQKAAFYPQKKAMEMFSLVLYSTGYAGRIFF